MPKRSSESSAIMTPDALVTAIVAESIGGESNEDSGPEENPAAVALARLSGLKGR